ncbi:MAG: hypothetical protein ACF8XB_04020, partial [Planctomycetota bacterium JB042]
PHQPFVGEVWAHHDDVKRPLLEIYQGFRDRDAEADAAAGLARGYRFGFVASSDHLSTRASWAGVWTTAVDRESIFRAMQSRRTFAATARATLVLRSGPHWMGERFVAAAPPTFGARYDGTARVSAITWVADGEEHRIEMPPSLDSREWTYTPDDVTAPGEHRVHVRIEQGDGHRAWSSPLWYTLR